jgi:hypothetical protein
MIKIALKHFLYDQAIDVFFKEVVKNFVRPNLEQSVVDKILALANQIRMQPIPIGSKVRRISSSYTLESCSDIETWHSPELDDMLLEVLMEELNQNGSKYYPTYISGGGWSSGTQDSGIIFSPYISTIFSSTEEN